MAQKITNLDQAEIEIRTGIVAANQNWSSSNVNVQTRTTHDTATGHARSDVDVSSSSTEQVRLFVHGDDGSEFEIRAHNVGFGFREGHRISAVYLGAVGDSHRSDGENLVGLMNHSTGKQTLFSNSVRKRLSAPLNLIGIVTGLAMIIAGPILIFKLWSAFGPGDEDLGWLFVKGMGSLMIGVFGAMFLHARLTAMLRPKSPSLEESVLGQLNDAMGATTEQEKAKLSAAPN